MMLFDDDDAPTVPAPDARSASLPRESFDVKGSRKGSFAEGVTK
jgi:hypothetical protein